MASKKESTFINMVLALLIVSLVASATLGFVYESTKEPIAEAQLNKKLTAIKEVVPAFDNDPNAEMFLIEVEGGEALEVYPAKMNGQLVGAAVKTYTNLGFSGLIRVMVGFTPDGTIYNYQVLEHKETPGLGTKMADWFKPVLVTDSLPKEASFFDWLFGIKPGSGGDGKVIVGKNPGQMNLTVSKDGGDVDAITAATISSRAFLDAVSRAYNGYMKKNEAIENSANPADSSAVNTEVEEMAQNKGGN
jgi:electron transport complex protein RnfG